MAKLLYVVHRYAPYPGGSEYNVQRYAEASIQLGHEVTVLANTHCGNYNGVTVTSDINIIHNQFDLCIVHGWTGGMQNYVIQNSNRLRYPLFYMIIKPDSRPEIELAFRNASYIGCATSQDVLFASYRGYSNKIVRINYPIEYIPITKPKEKIREEFGITAPRTVISVGGFAPHKGMDELVAAFEELNDPHTQLILTGYDLNHPTPNISNCKSNITIFHVEDPHMVHELMSVADLLIWNSIAGTEGYGLVLLEAMLYGCNWYARNTAAGMDLSAGGFGIIYDTKDQLVKLMEEYTPEIIDINTKKLYVRNHHDPLIVTAKMLNKLI